MKVSLFTTCLGDLFYVDVLKDVTEVLERLGCEVDVPEGQVCCGQPAYNSGYAKDTKGPAKNMIRAFEHSDYIVCPSGSCATMFHEYPNFFADEPEWQEKAKNIADKTYEFTQFIVRVLGVVDVGAEYHARATLHTSCHMTRLLGEREAHYTLLKHVKGLDLVPLPNNYDCCGFGGTFSVKMFPISEQMVDEKIRHIEETDAEVVVGADASCLMNIGGRMKRLGRPIKVLHIAQILNSHQTEGAERHADESRKSTIL
ncbi:(Fe-S)-binding protein [Sporolactobacillus sp. STSJ-5]|uniref:(Fe-S)-binding protein n=1 Tax=Sporolactobacillus sp. STSJ-5 TaxID=2965076 RepID=UPI0021067D0E|nr:(Fe-S)-binding protein [Sporolactobacillus sp. STSJ-5]